MKCLLLTSTPPRLSAEWLCKYLLLRVVVVLAAPPVCVVNQILVVNKQRFMGIELSV